MEQISIFSQGASPARTYPLLENRVGLGVRGQDYGQNCAELLAKLDPITQSWKTCQTCLMVDGENGFQSFLKIWPRSGMMQNGIVFKLPLLAHHISGTVSGLLPTLRASTGKPAKGREGLFSKHYRHQLEEYINGKPNPQFAEWMMGYPQMWTDV